MSGMRERESRGVLGCCAGWGMVEVTKGSEEDYYLI